MSARAPYRPPISQSKADERHAFIRTVRFSNGAAAVSIKVTSLADGSMEVVVLPETPGVFSIIRAQPDDPLEASPLTLEQ